MQVERAGDQFIARVADPALEFVVSNVDDRHGAFQALVRCFYLNGSRASIAPPTRANLYTPQGLSTLAKAWHENRRGPAQMDRESWRQLAAALADGVTEAWEEGEPF